MTILQLMCIAFYTDNTSLTTTFRHAFYGDNKQTISSRILSLDKIIYTIEDYKSLDIDNVSLYIMDYQPLF